MFLIISLTKGDGTALGYFIFYTKIHVLCLMAVVTARVELSQQGRGGTYVSVLSQFWSRSLTDRSLAVNPRAAFGLPRLL